MAKMNHWRAGQLYRKSTLDWRWETLVPDRAGRWLRAVERNQRERRTVTASSSAIAARTAR